MATLVTIFLSAVLPWAGPAVAQEEAVDLAYKEAVAAFQGEEYERAAGLFEKLLEEDPDWAAGYVILGQCQLMLGDAERADGSILKAKELDPETELFEAYVGAGQMLFKKKDFPRAAAALERALRHAGDTEKRQTWLQLAYAYLQGGQPEESRKSIEKYQAEYGADGTSTMYLALACQKMKDYPRALEVLREASGAATERGQKLQLLEYLAKWSHYWALLPDNQSRRQELLDQAVTDTRSWYVADWENPEAQEHYAEMLFAAGREKQVIDEFYDEAGRDDANCRAKTMLAKAFNALGDANQAEAWAEGATRCDPTDADSFVELAVARVHQLRPEHSQVAEASGDRALAEGAVESLRRALEIEKDHRRATSLLGEAEKSLRELKQTEADLRRSDEAYRKIAREADQERIERQCLAIHWKRQKESGGITAEDEAFFEEHDCRQYVPTNDGGSR
jgi:tetratricopeptide (TPR) repeat protein